MACPLFGMSTIGRFHCKMEYQKIGNLLYNTTSQSSIFRAKTWVEIIDARRESYCTDGGEMLKSDVCDYNDVNIPVRGITVNSCWI